MQEYRPCPVHTRCIILQPLTVSEHALLMRAILGAHPVGAFRVSKFAPGEFVMTARTEVASLAGIGQQVVMAALIAVDARKTFAKITTVEKAFDDRGLYRPVDQPAASRSSP